MIEETGRVLSIEEGFADVETIRTSSCTSCRARHGCGHHAIAQVSSSNRMRMRAIDPLSVEIGQSVVVGIPEDTLLQASVWMYLIPLFGLVGGAVIPSLWGGESGIAVIFSIMGFAGGLLLARNKSKQEMNNLDYYPKILRIESLNDDHIPLVVTS
ncbi:positive regulator of sigma(E), RseC/MucC [Marinomonas polaris DSM 16579]|uniref:Positive regulator of sigma(E), RseC/MucC n=1 Tax=Marinomonas polaris DSM 16579 TaxID=1122206 RepID=A0A1M5BPU5_9GAMM|nr:SoxR reducing system RseC family protein [Marinomonas polaris]SHF44613.1 positive regulator of sigma(E), RseC/MucC [Marinomonas polaris DSM 16579]|tara:strand:- start:4731 stop:5198 length:468 start_codon:yes stop_codon:yes gene_type:complete